MNIDDILNEPQSETVNNLLFERMRHYGGPILLGRMRELFDSPADARDWFYSRNYSLGQKRPYDVCKDGKVELAFAALDSYERATLGVLA